MFIFINMLFELDIIFYIWSVFLKMIKLFCTKQEKEYNRNSKILFFSLQPWARLTLLRATQSMRAISALV